MFTLQFTDVLNAILPIASMGRSNYTNPDNTNSSRLYANFFSSNSTWTLTLSRAEERICANGRGVIAGRGISYADIYLSSLLDLANVNGTNQSRDVILNSYPNIKALDLRVRTLPGVAAWLVTRPVTAI